VEIIDFVRQIAIHSIVNAVDILGDWQNSPFKPCQRTRLHSLHCELQSVGVHLQHIA